MTILHKKNNMCVLLFCISFVVILEEPVLSFTRAINEAENDIHFGNILFSLKGLNAMGSDTSAKNGRCR